METRLELQSKLEELLGCMFTISPPNQSKWNIPQ